MKERKNIMRTTKRNSMSLWSLVIGLFLLMSVQAQAVEFKNTYSGSRQTVGSYQATAPTVSFHSTSAYSGQLGTAEVSMLNADGSINTEAYGVGRNNAPGIRKSSTPPPPGQQEEGEQLPVGDGLWGLLALAAAYAVYRRRTRILEP